MDRSRTLLAVLLVVVFLAAVSLVVLYSGFSPDLDGNETESGAPGEDVFEEDGEGPWMGEFVKKEVVLEGLRGSDVRTGTIHVFEEKPRTESGRVLWGNEREVERFYGSSEEFDQVPISSGPTMLQYRPGRYFVAVESDGYYTRFGSIVVPDGSGYNRSLESYNRDPESTRFTMTRVFDPSPSSLDLGVDGNTSSTLTWSSMYSLEPGLGTEFHALKMEVSTGEVDPTSFSGGSSDEGVRRIYFEFSGGNLEGSRRVVVFDLEDGVDRLGGDDRALIMLDDVVADDVSSLEMEVVVVTSETSTAGASSGDGVLTDGETFLRYRLFGDNGAATSSENVTA